ncbi:MAG: GAF domain-containing sensor histidine kinase [Actinomycetota bacterium]
MDGERRQQALVEAGLALTSEHSLPKLLEKIVQLACSVSGARYGALGVIDESGTGLGQFLTHGVTEEERRAIGDLPRGRGILGILIREATPLRLKNISDDPRSVGFPPNHPPMKTFLGVPLSIRGKTFGNLYLTEKAGGEEFSKDDEQVVITLAAQAAIAIENASLEAQVQRLAIIEERERIAKELHDDIVQSLFAEGMSLEAARGFVNDPAKVDARLSQAVDNIDRVIRDLRGYIFGMRPGSAADRHLEEALIELVSTYEQSANIEVKVDSDVAALLAGKAQQLIQAAREALSNAVRHSNGSKIKVSLVRLGDTAVFSVEDNGTGFDLEAAERKGNGLRNLLDRAEAMSGSLQIMLTEPGTKIMISIPL